MYTEYPIEFALKPTLVPCFAKLDLKLVFDFVPTFAEICAVVPNKVCLLWVILLAGLARLSTPPLLTGTAGGRGRGRRITSALVCVVVDVDNFVQHKNVVFRVEIGPVHLVVFSWTIQD
jgi:hypothetical protein